MMKKILITLMSFVLLVAVYFWASVGIFGTGLLGIIRRKKEVKINLTNIYRSLARGAF
jgi:hypothetical protein